MDFILNEDLQQAIRLAQNSARQNLQGNYSPGHLLWAMLQEDIGLHPYLAQLGKDPHRLRSWAQFRVDHYPKSATPTDTIEADDKVKVLLKEADTIRKKNFDPAVTPLHVLEAISRPHVAFTPEQLKRFPLAPGEIQVLINNSGLLEQLTGAESSGDSTVATAARPAVKTSLKALEKYCDDLTQKARDDKIDPVIGRDLELKKLVEILGKRNSPNVLILGEPGVGKTAIVGGLALNILEGKVPKALQGASVFELDVNGRLVAGAYRGEVEERLKNVLKAIKDHGKAILFIDEIHALLDETGSVGSGAVNLLKPELSRGEITVIGATTLGEYSRHIESDEAFNRRFTLLTIEEPDEESAIEMIEGLVYRFEDHHGLKVAPEAVSRAVKLSRRYVGTRRLPSSAIELIDFSMASIGVMNDTSLTELERLEKGLAELKEQRPAEEEKQLNQRLKRFDDQIRAGLSHILVSRVEAGMQENGKEQSLSIGFLEQKLSGLKELSAEAKTDVGPEDITAMISYQTGIPMGKLQAGEKEKMQKLEEHLRARVVGQDHALTTVARVLRRSRADLKEANKPIGVFFFVGPTGTGKTELAKTIAELLFNDEQALIRFDMSEFKEEHSAALLYGAPPGYVGYKEGGLLVNKIRQRPYSVVLFDEIEKGHPNVYDIFLQIVDEGKVTDKLKKEGDFSNAIVIFTSNLGAEWVAEQFRDGSPPTNEDMRNFMKDLIGPNGRKVFRPEFLARRIEMVPFAPISREVADLIFGIHFKNFCKLLDQQKISLELGQVARDKLVEEGYSEVFGARPIKDTIENRLGTPIAEKIIAEEVKKGSRLSLDLDEEGEWSWTVN